MNMFVACFMFDYYLNNYFKKVVHVFLFFKVFYKDEQNNNLRKKHRKIWNSETLNVYYAFVVNM